MNIGINNSPSLANTVTPFSPVGRTAQTEEDAAAQNSSLAPLEEADESADIDNQRRRAGAEEGNAGEDEGEKLDSQRAEQQERRQEELAEQELRQLRVTDREVRAHEQAHSSVGGRYAGAPSYEYERGSDGVNYAVAGEVPIDISKIPGDPQATLQKALVVGRAALAPADPSAQDRLVAARAAQMAMEARAEIAAQARQPEEGGARSESADSPSSSRESADSGADRSLAGSRENDSRAAARRLADAADSPNSDPLGKNLDALV